MVYVYFRWVEVFDRYNYLGIEVDGVVIIVNLEGFLLIIKYFSSETVYVIFIYSFVWKYLCGFILLWRVYKVES